MQVSEIYSHKGGLDFVQEQHPLELKEIIDAIKQVNGVACLNKLCLERGAKSGRLILNPASVNKSIKSFLCLRGWTQLSKGKKGFKEPRVYVSKSIFREMDGIKNHVGLEIQFGKYSFMGYDILLKMPIFAKLGLIDCGIEVVPSHHMMKRMSSGVSYYNQIVCDLQARGEADIDLPTIIIGVEPTTDESALFQETRTTIVATKHLPGPKQSD